MRKIYLGIIVSILLSSFQAHARSDFSNAMFFRNAGIVGAGFISAFDVLNRILTMSELNAQASSCENTVCASATREQQTLNAVGLGFEVLPPLGVLMTILVYAARSDNCIMLPSADEGTISRVTALAAALALLGSSVGLGTAAKNLAIATELRPSGASPLTDYGRFIASTVLSGASVVASVCSGIAVLSVR